MTVTLSLRSFGNVFCAVETKKSEAVRKLDKTSGAKGPSLSSIIIWTEENPFFFALYYNPHPFLLHIQRTK